jgi:malonyl CoA-acyl carrier protein transacylase
VRRAALLCPGRGSYGERSLGSLPGSHAWVSLADRLRAERELEPLSALDRAERFEPARHLRPADVSPLIYLVSMLDGAAVTAGPDAPYRPVCVAGNSMGWYTALALAGALSFEDGFRLVQEMSLLQEEGSPGGQVIHPVVDEEWRRDAELEASVRAALAGAAGQAFPSIRLGGYEVLAGSPEGVSHLLAALPRTTRGGTTYPLRLAQHGPYHTPLAREVAERARGALADLAFRRPRVALIDGRGRRHTPWSADVDLLRDYTLGEQVTTPYDVTASVRVALREHAPERLVLPGPGNTLGGVSGQILAAEGWRGIRSRADFDAVQAGDAPIVDSLRR